VTALGAQPQLTTVSPRLSAGSAVAWVPVPGYPAAQLRKAASIVVRPPSLSALIRQRVQARLPIRQVANRSPLRAIAARLRWAIATLADSTVAMP